MAYGFQCLTDTGYTQIDGDYKNLFYKRTIYGSLSYNGITAPILTSGIPNITPLNSNEFIFWLPSSTTEAMNKFNYTTFVTFTDDNEYLRSSNYGFEVYNSSNNLAFTSNSRPLIVRGVYTLNSPFADVIFNTVNFSIPPLITGRSRAVFVSTPNMKSFDTYFEPDYLLVTGLWSGNGSLYLEDASAHFLYTIIIVDF